MLCISTCCENALHVEVFFFLEEKVHCEEKGRMSGWVLTVVHTILCWK